MVLPGPVNDLIGSQGHGDGTDLIMAPPPLPRDRQHGLPKCVDWSWSPAGQSSQKPRFRIGQLESFHYGNPTLLSASRLVVFTKHVADFAILKGYKLASVFLSP